MPNNLQVSDIVGVALALMERDAVLNHIAYRDSESDFVGGVGSSVRIRIPRPIASRDGAEDGDTVYSDVNEDAVSIELTKELYSAVPLTDRELSLDLVSYSSQVVQPQIAGLVRDAEQTAAEALNGAIGDESEREIDPENPLAAVRAAAAEMVRRGNPTGSGESFFVIGPDLVEAFYASDSLRDASALGSDGVIRAGHIGRVHGFDVVVSPFIEGGAVALNRGAFALAVRAPVAPEGAYSASHAEQGYALRHVRDFVMGARSEVSLISAFVGATALDEQRMIPFILNSGESS